jgi:hypothetical protein
MINSSTLLFIISAFSSRDVDDDDGDDDSDESVGS